jgi:hypothetical protein
LTSSVAWFTMVLTCSSKSGVLIVEILSGGMFIISYLFTFVNRRYKINLIKYLEIIMAIFTFSTRPTKSKDTEVVKEVKKLCEARGMNFSSLIIQLLRAYLKEQTND